MAKLTPKQERFVNEYLVDLNATAAAKRAGYSEKSASRIAIELLNKTHVSAAIQERRAKLRGKLEITQEKVIQELAKVAFANGTMYAQVTGGTVVLTETDQLTEDQRAAISGIKEGKYGIEVNTYDKVRALELLGKHLGVFDARSGTWAVEGNNLLEIIQKIGEIDTDDIPEAE